MLPVKYVTMAMCDWLEGQINMKAEWRYVSTMSGEQSAVICGQQLMEWSCATSSDTKQVVGHVSIKGMACHIGMIAKLYRVLF